MSNSAYNSLLHKIRELAKSQDETYREQIRCEAGCYHCCHPPDSLFQVEAETLENGIATLTDEQKERIAKRLQAYEQDNSLLCPLLEHGNCMVYESRPSICRTQGYALWLHRENDITEANPMDPTKASTTTESHKLTESSEGSTLSWCQLNFTEQQPNKELAFDVERLNTMLSLITQLGWPNQPSRRELTSIIHTGIYTKTLNINKPT